MSEEEYGEEIKENLSFIDDESDVKWEREDVL